MNMDINLSTRTKKAKRKLKKISEVFAKYFHENINFCTENSILPPDLKVADVTPAFKKKSKTSKDN